MEKKTDTTIQGLGSRVLGLGCPGLGLQDLELSFFGFRVESLGPGFRA